MEVAPQPARSTKPTHNHLVALDQELALPGSQAVGDALKPFNAGFVTVENVGEIMVARTGYTGEDGFELVVPAAQIAGVWERLLQAGVRPAGPVSYTHLTLPTILRV